MSKSVLATQAVSKIYENGPQPVKVLTDINFQINEGEISAIVGASGSGKSTLLNLLGGLDNPSDGEVLLCEHVLSKASEKQRSLWRNEFMGFIYQFHHLLPEFTALENVAMPLFIGKTSKQEAEHRAAVLLEKVGLSARVLHKPAELSGGERQRVAIARALVNDPAVVLADEPTGNLDSKTADAVHELMLSLNQELNTAFVVVTHDMDLAQRIPTIWQLTDGKLAKS